MTPLRTPDRRRSRSLGAAALALLALLILALAASSASAASVQVRPGDTLSGIAARAGVSVQALAAANGIADPDLVVAGTRLTLPGTAGAPSAPGAGAPAGAGARHTVRAGESLWVIAARAGVSVRALAAANGIADPDRVIAGSSLVIPGRSAGSPAPAAPAAAAGAGSVTVRAGESLSVIAARAGVSVQSLAAANGIADPDRVAAGAVLRLPVAGAASPAPGGGVPAGFTPDRNTVAQLLDQASLRHGVDARLVRAVAWQESGWNQGAVSSTGAVGVMQLMPATARWLGRDVLRRPFDPASVGDNIDGGVAFLAWLHRRTGDTRTAVAAYYQGLDSVRRIGFYDDTTAYVASVLSLRGRV